MCRVAMLLLLTVAVPLAAQDINLTADDIAAMQKQAGQAQACLAKIDQSRLQELQAQGEKQMEEVTALCQAGKRDEAQATAIKFARALMADPLMQEAQSCIGLISMTLPQSMWTELEKEDTPAHVCEL